MFSYSLSESSYYEQQKFMINYLNSTKIIPITSFNFESVHLYDYVQEWDYILILSYFNSWLEQQKYRTTIFFKCYSALFNSSKFLEN